MAPWAFLHSLSDPGRQHPATPQILAIALLNGLSIEIPPEFEMMKTNRTPEYLAKFPLGKIPALETAEGFNLTENNAIASYVAEKGPKKDQFLGTTPELHALVHQWVFFTSSHLQETVLSLVRPHLGFQTYDPEVEKKDATNLKRWLEYIEKQLDGRTWIIDEQDGRKETGPSLADLTVAQCLRMGFRYYLDKETRAPYPNLVSWWGRLMAIPEIEKGFDGNVMVEKRKDLSKAS